MNYLFDKNWFQKHQRKLLWLLNASLIKIWFRWVMRIDCNQEITEITPNSFSFGDRYFKKGEEWHRERITDFRTHNKYGKRLFYVFYPLWLILHNWDIVINFLRLPKLNFGFDTLTVYPDPNPETNTVDGWVARLGQNEVFSTIRTGAGTDAADSTNNNDLLLGRIDATTTSNQYSAITRGIYLFDTSSLGASASISAATISWSGTGVAETDAFTQTLHVVASGPASNTALAAADYTLPGNWGTTSFASLAYASWNQTNNTYNDFALNADGLNNISKTGISKFGTRMSGDLNNSAPTWSSNGQSMIPTYSADNAGTSSDPKLVITYTLVTFIPKIMVI